MSLTSLPVQVQDLADEIVISPGVVAGASIIETGDYTKFSSLLRTVPHDLLLADL